MSIRRNAIPYVVGLRIAERLVRPAVARACLKIRSRILLSVSRFKRMPDPRDLATFGDIARELGDAFTFANLTAASIVKKQLKRQSVALELSPVIKGTFRQANQATLEYLRNLYETKAFDIISGVSEYADRMLRDALADSFTEGVPIKTIIGDLEQAMNKLGITGQAPFRIETIARTQTQIAFNAGKFNSENSVEIGPILWGYNYVTVGDYRVREEHALLDGVILPKEDSFWRTNYPPNGWNCRCQVIPLFDEEKSIAPPEEYNGPDNGFNFNPGNVFSGI